MPIFQEGAGTGILAARPSSVRVASPSGAPGRRLDVVEAGGEDVLEGGAPVLAQGADVAGEVRQGREALRVGAEDRGSEQFCSPG